MTQHVLIANDLLSGAIVYRTADGWSPKVNEARVAEDDAEAEALMAEGKAAEADNAVVAAELIPVTAEAGAVTPNRLREVIRAQGPTVRPDLGYQADFRN